MRIINPRRFIGFLAIVILFIGGVIWWSVNGAKLTQGGQLEVKQGTAAAMLWQQAAEKGFTRGTVGWRWHAWRQKAEAKIQAGSYELNEGEQINDVIIRLINGDTRKDELTITFPEGFTLQQIAERTAARGIGTVEEFLAEADGREGYLFPDTYRVFSDDTPAAVVKRLIANFNDKIATLQADIDASGRTVDQIVIMASIIEREAQHDRDMALVSGVLWQRFDDGVGLDADATVRYAVGKQTEVLTWQDLDFDSPYNTRKFRGLPPGPISNPGLRALQAAVNPESSDYYYYLHTPNGETIFSKSNDEHNANKAKYLR